MKKERPPWLIPFATAGGLWIVGCIFGLVGRPREELLPILRTDLAYTGGGVLLVAAILLLLLGANRGRVRRVAARRRGWDVTAVWADESLGENLAALGVDRILPRAPAALVMACSRQGLELWDGSRHASRLVRVDWRDVRSIDETPASCGTLAMHGVAISLVSRVQVVVCPSRRPTGGAGGASALQVRVLAEHLRGFLGTSPLRR